MQTNSKAHKIIQVSKQSIKKFTFQMGLGQINDFNLCLKVPIKI